MTKLTIGMATASDFEGLYFTLQALQLYHHIPNEIEYVVVDNQPHSNQRTMIEGICQAVNAKYVPMQSPIGTSQSRNRVFQEASSPYVMCIDSHIMLVPNSVRQLFEYINRGLIGDNLYSGPLLLDHRRGVNTHFNPVWRSEMLGVWGAAYKCSCLRPQCSQFTLIEDRSEAGKVLTKSMLLTDGRTPIEWCSECQKRIPSFDWSGHEMRFQQDGYQRIGFNPTDAPFEIPAQGLGLFLSKKDSWLGFNQYATGFGAEEVNIHDLYRQHGRKCICLPYLQWIHRFARPHGVPYPLQRYNKVRNYVLWYQQLNKPLDEIREHFVDTGLFSKEEWEHLLSDPIHHVDAPPGKSGCSSCGGAATAKQFASMDEAFDHYKNTNRDLNQHMPIIREYANKCNKVTDFSIRRESAVAMAASKAEFVTSYSFDLDATALAVCFKHRQFRHGVASWVDLPNIEPTDFLFLNTKHTGPQIERELTAFTPKVSKYIAFHNTAIYAERGEEPGTPGIMVAVRKFLRANPEWTVCYHTNDQYGFTIISRLPEDRQKPPGKIRQALNFTKAVTEHIATGASKSSEEVFETRLDICATCEHRNVEQCGICGCNIFVKASWETSECPIARW